jgi:hypothetical protein
MEDIPQFIVHDFGLPNHQEELKTAEDSLNALKLRLVAVIVNETINDKLHEELFEATFKILDYVGRLSIPCFKVNYELERMYVNKYPHSPALAKKLWLDHYESIHRPYNLIKNRCFRTINDIDQAYRNKFDKQPPNWNDSIYDEQSPTFKS